MKNKLRALIAICALCVLASLAADSVAPASAGLTFIRGEVARTVSVGACYRGTTFVLTNCLTYADTTGVTTQGLDGVTVEVAIGTNGVASLTNTATVTSAADGKWATSLTVPSAPSFTLELKITDASTNSYVYPSKTINTTESLFQ
jgi:hypothetical protein